MPSFNPTPTPAQLIKQEVMPTFSILSHMPGQIFSMKTTSGNEYRIVRTPEGKLFIVNMRDNVGKSNDQITGQYLNANFDASVTVGKVFIFGGSVTSEIKSFEVIKAEDTVDGNGTGNKVEEKAPWVETSVKDFNSSDLKDKDILVVKTNSGSVYWLLKGQEGKIAVSKRIDGDTPKDMAGKQLTVDYYDESNLKNISEGLPLIFTENLDFKGRTTGVQSMTLHSRG